MTNPAGEQLRRITGRGAISWSQIRLYAACPRAFSLRYIQRVSPLGIPASMAIGTAVHHLVQIGLERARAEHRPLDRSQQLEAAGVALCRNGTILPNQREQRLNLAEEAVRLAGPALDRLLPRSFSTVAIEHTFEFTVDRNLPPVTGRIDLVQLTREGATIVDLKTARGTLQPEQVEELWPQLALYGLWWQRVAGWGQPAQLNLRLLVVSRHKPPRIQEHTMPLSTFLARRSVGLLESAWRGIQAGSFAARPSWRCRMCLVRHACPWGSATTSTPALTAAIPQ